MNTYLNSPKATPAMPPAKPIAWTGVIIAAIAAGTVISVTDIVRQQQPSRPAPAAIAVVQPTPLPTPVAVPTPVPVPTPAPVPIDPPVQRALPVEPEVRHALPVEGQLYLITMPDGTHPLIRFMGAVRDFDHLPKNPALWDLYQIASSGHSWVFMQPAGFSNPSWVDP